MISYLFIHGHGWLSNHSYWTMGQSGQNGQSGLGPSFRHGKNHGILLEINLTKWNNGINNHNLPLSSLGYMSLSKHYIPCPSTWPPFFSTQRLARFSISRTALRIIGAWWRRASNSSMILCWRVAMSGGGVINALLLR